MKRITKHGKVRNTLRRIGRGIAAGLLLAGLMLGTGKAKADPKPSLGVSLGAGYSIMEKEPRMFATLSGSVPLPLKMNLFASAGIAGAEGKAKVEETTLEIIRGFGPLTLAAGGYTSAHLWTDKLSPYGTVALKLPHAFAISGDYIYLRGLEDPHLLMLKASKGFLDGKFSLFAKGGWTVPNGWAARAGLSVKSDNLPAITLDGIAIGERKKAAFADVVLSAGWRF